jgi:hypothetical protein
MDGGEESWCRSEASGQVYWWFFPHIVIGAPRSEGSDFKEGDTVTVTGATTVGESHAPGGGITLGLHLPRWLSALPAYCAL